MISEKLEKYLLQNFRDFQSIDPSVAPGGSDAANKIIAAALAQSIARAFEDVLNVHYVGLMTCDQINAQDKMPGHVYTTSDSGVLIGNPPIDAVYGDVVLWSSDHFVRIFNMSVNVDGAMSDVSANPVQNKVVTSAIKSEAQERGRLYKNILQRLSRKENSGTAANEVSSHNSSGTAHSDIRELVSSESSSRQSADSELQTAIENHAEDTDNPHNVTASQVGADPSGTAANEVSNHNSSSLAHADLFDAKENAGTAESAVASHNNSDTAHEGLFTALSDALSTETSERRASDNSLTESLDSLEDDFRLHKYSNNPHPQFTPSVDVSNVTTLDGIQTPLQRGQIIYCTVNIGNTEPTTVLRTGFRSGSRLATFDSVTLRLAYRGGSQVGYVVTFYFGQVFGKKDYQMKFTYNTATATGAWTPINVEEL